MDGRTLRLSEEAAERVPPAKGTSAKLSQAAPSLLIPRTAGSRPRAGLGKSRAATTSVNIHPSVDNGSAAGASQVNVAPTSQKGQDDFRKLLLGGK
jgi:squamous cell carcinoma antigen recognized by T-cells 3